MILSVELNSLPSFFLATTIIPINKPSIAVKASLRITINKLNDEEQLAQFGFIFNKATERQRLAVRKQYPLVIKFSLIHKESI